MEKQIEKLNRDIENLKEVTRLILDMQEKGIGKDGKKVICQFDLFLNLSRLFKFLMDSNEFLDGKDKTDVKEFRKIFDLCIKFLEKKGFEVIE